MTRAHMRVMRTRMTRAHHAGEAPPGTTDRAENTSKNAGLHDAKYVL